MQLLGPVRSWTGDAEVDLGTTRQKAVLAVLALAPGQVVPVSRIVGAVWADEPPVNGANVVQKYVAGLRRAMEPDRPARSPGQVITFQDGGYRLATAPDAVDAVALERRAGIAAEALRSGRAEDALIAAEAALATWHGEPLAGLPGPWFASRRGRLTDVRARIVETWAAAQLALGRPEAAVDELAALLTTQPLRERCGELLVLALHRTGRTTEALQAYRQLRRDLVEQTGLEPSPALRALHQQLLSGRPEPVTTGGPAPGGPTPGLALRDPAPPPWPPPLLSPQPWPPVPLPPVPSSSSSPSPRRAARVGRTALGLVAALVPLVSVGIAAWPVIGLLAVVRRSTRLAVATVGYLALTTVGFVLLGPEHPSELGADLGTVVMLVLAFGGSIHAAALMFQLGRARGRS